tara:strand:- start:389 stop:967 length:579 start_codon:yes stop_codon:yes gene_type:complete
MSRQRTYITQREFGEKLKKELMAAPGDDRWIVIRHKDLRRLQNSTEGFDAATPKEYPRGPLGKMLQDSNSFTLSIFGGFDVKGRQWTSANVAVTFRVTQRKNEKERQVHWLCWKQASQKDNGNNYVEAKRIEESCVEYVAQMIIRIYVTGFDKERPSHGVKSRTKKEHDSMRCEACQNGFCTAGVANRLPGL